ncbi:hypothetical protein ACFL4Q_02620 [candidate division KSB1 bacterium]
MNKIERRYTFSYIGEQNVLNLNTLISTQMHLSAVLNEINKVVCPDCELQIKIESFSNGSFDVNLIYELLPLAGILLGSYNVDTIASLIEFFTATIKLKQFLKGEEPDSTQVDGDSTVVNKGGKQNTYNTNVYNLYIESDVLNNNLRSAFITLDDDTSINDFELREKKRTLIKVKRDDFSSLGVPNKIIQESKHVFENKIELAVVKPDFDTKKKRKWGFIYKGRFINAKITHDKFYEQIDEGTKFGQGDSLVVDMIIYKEFDKRYNTYIDSSYEITIVHKILPREQQGDLSFE